MDKRTLVTVSVKKDFTVSQLLCVKSAFTLEGETNVL